MFNNPQFNWGPLNKKKRPGGQGSGNFLEQHLAQQAQQGGGFKTPKDHLKNEPPSASQQMAQSMIGKMAGQAHPVLGMLAGPLMASYNKSQQFIQPNVEIKGPNAQAMPIEKTQVAGAAMTGGQPNPFAAASDDQTERYKRMLMGGGSYA